MNGVVCRDIRVQKPALVREGFTEETIGEIRGEGGCDSNEGNKKNIQYIWETARSLVLLLESSYVLPLLCEGFDPGQIYFLGFLAKRLLVGFDQ